MATDALIAQTGAPLINGVSQQPAHSRLPSQAEAQENILSDVASGIVRRPPAEFIALLTGSAAGAIPTGGYKVHPIDLGDGNKFFAIVEDGDINVYDEAGTEITIAENAFGAAGVAGSWTYLNITPADGDAESSFALTTVADYTFIVNKQITALKAGATSAARTHAHEFLYFAKSFSTTAAAAEISLAFDSSVETTGGTGNSSIVELDSLCTLLTGGANPSDTTGTGGGSVNDWKFTRVNDNLLHGYQFQGTNDTVKASDASGNTLHTFVTTGPNGEDPQVARFSDLPAEGVDGFVVKVKGEDGTSDDDFYVVYDASEKVWKETVQPGLANGFDQDTLPHELVYVPGTNSFTFGPVTWDARGVGDTTSAPDPSFVGKTISDILVHKNRLVLVSDENAIGSETGEFFNFWPTTVTTIVDSDPWDTAGTGNRVATWDYAIPFLGGITLFSPVGSMISEVIGSQDEPLTVKNVRIEERGVWEHADVRPVVAGSSLYFVLDKGVYSSVFQYTNVRGNAFDADEITSHVPKYLPTGITKISAGLAENILTFQTSEELNALYVYRFHYLAGEQVMASWSKWTFETNAVIVSADWMGSVLYLMIHRQDGLHLEKMDFGKTDEDEDAGATPLGYRVHLDSMISVTGTYDAGLNLTTWITPYDNLTNGGTFMGVKGGAWTTTRGAIIESHAVLKADLAFVATGNYTAFPVYIGRAYTSTYELSQPVLKETSTTSRRPARLAGRLHVTQARVAYDDTVAFSTAIASREDALSHTDEFESPDGVSTPTEGVFAFAVGEDSRHVRILLYGVDCYPFKFSAVELDGRFTQHTTQI